MKEAILRIVSRMAETNTVNDSTNLFDDLGFDSAKTIELIVELEKQFNISIKDEDLNVDNFQDLRSIIELIKSYTNQ